MFFGSKVAMKSVTAAEGVALSAWRAFSVGDRVGAVVFNDSEMKEIRPHRSRGRVMEILQTVMEFNHRLRIDSGIEPGPQMLNRALEKTYRLVSHDCLVGVFSDFSGANEETRGWLTKMAEHNDVILALIYDPLQVELPEKGRMVVSDGDLQIELDVGEEKTRKAVTEFFPERFQDMKDMFKQLAVPVLPIHTAEGVAEQVRKLLGYMPRSSSR
jgi:uncharacterized protein (DUF58 family)